MSLSVKLFIKKSGSDEQLEVRRFSIDEDVSTSYEYLTAKIRATLPCAGDTAIGLFWQGNRNFCAFGLHVGNILILVGFFGKLRDLSRPPGGL